MDLKQAGFKVEKLCCESIFSESQVVSNSWLGRVDHLLSHILPPQLGYGILAIAKPDIVSQWGKYEV